jgi:hypothetical protein
LVDSFTSSGKNFFSKRDIDNILLLLKKCNFSAAPGALQKLSEDMLLFFNYHYSLAAAEQWGQQYWSTLPNGRQSLFNLADADSQEFVRCGALSN